MSNNSDDNDLIDINKPAQAPVRAKPSVDAKPTHPKPVHTQPVIEPEKYKDVTGSSSFDDSDSVRILPSEATEIVDSKFVVDQSHGETYKQYDWVRSPLTHFVVVVILGLIFWRLFDWGWPIIGDSWEDGRYDDVFSIGFFLILPILAYSWFLKVQNNPGYGTDETPSASGRSGMGPWF